MNPLRNGGVDFFADGILVADTVSAAILYAGPCADLPAEWAQYDLPTYDPQVVILPPFLDAHTHLPQYPIRGRFVEGVADGEPARLLAGLNRNVFPEEARHADADYTALIAAAFRDATLAHGVVGGAAYGTVHARAAHTMLTTLSPYWSVGLVLMNQNCPDYLRTDEDTLAGDIADLAERFGPRLIVTDRFAVSVDTPLRRRGVALARAHGLRMQTHLNEQKSEKAFVERTLYPAYESYTDVYRRDGLLERTPILAHCIQMTPSEWRMLSDSGAAIAHCPTSNALLGSGTMPLDDLPTDVPYAICTDVGASPTCSLLAEMVEFLTVHRGRSARATPEAALFHATLAPAQILGLADEIGTLAPGMPLSYIVAKLPAHAPAPRTAAEAICALLDMPSEETLDPVLAETYRRLGEGELSHCADLNRLADDAHRTANRLEERIARVVVRGEAVWP